MRTYAPFTYQKLAKVAQFTLVVLQIVVIVSTAVIAYFNALTAAKFSALSANIMQLAQEVKADETANTSAHQTFITRDMFAQYEEDMKQNFADIKKQLNIIITHLIQ